MGEAFTYAKTIAVQFGLLKLTLFYLQLILNTYFPENTVEQK